MPQLISGRQQANAVLVLLVLCAGIGLYTAWQRIRHGPLVDVDDAGKIDWQLAIDINRAAAAEFQALPGVGPELAESIVAFRESLPGRRFRDIDQLEQVRGLGAARLGELRRWLVLPVESTGSQFP